jgi:hypothetical protein
MELLEERKTSAQRENRQVGDRATTGTSSHMHLSRGIFWNCCRHGAEFDERYVLFGAPAGAEWFVASTPMVRTTG